MAKEPRVKPSRAGTARAGDRLGYVPRLPDVSAFADQDIRLGQEAPVLPPIRGSANQSIQLSGTVAPVVELQGIVSSAVELEGRITTRTAGGGALRQDIRLPDVSTSISIVEPDPSLVLDTTEQRGEAAKTGVVRNPHDVDAVAKRLLQNPKLIAGVLRHAAGEISTAVSHARTIKPNLPEKLIAHEDAIETAVTWQSELVASATALEQPKLTIGRARKIARVLVGVFDQMVEHCSEISKPIAQLLINAGIAAAVAGALSFAINLPTKAIFWTSFGVLQSATIHRAMKPGEKQPRSHRGKGKSSTKPKKKP